MYRRPSLYAVFLSAISIICDPEMTFFSGTYPLIYSNPWSFYIQICYMRAYFWSPYLPHITRSACTCKFHFVHLLFHQQLYLQRCAQLLNRRKLDFTPNFFARCFMPAMYSSIFFVRHWRINMAICHIIFCNAFILGL